MKKVIFLITVITFIFLLGFSVSAEAEVTGIEVESGKITCLENAYGEFIKKLDPETGSYEEIYYYDFIMPDDIIMRITYSDGSYKLSSITRSVDGIMFKWFGNYQITDPWLVGKDNYITVEYLDHTAKLPVELIPNPIEYIETLTPPEREYIYGDDSYGFYNEEEDSYLFWPTDLYGFSFVIHYKNGEEKICTPPNDTTLIDGYRYTILSPDIPVKPGIHKVNFYYMGHTAEYTVSLRETRFPDVSKDSWYYEGVSYCFERGYMNGTDKGLFAPLSKLTREQFVLILARYADADLTKYESRVPSFRDIKQGEWYASAVEWARDSGIMLGTGQGCFGKGKAISRQELATVLYRFASPEKNTDSILPCYTDMYETADWAKDSIIWAISCGILGSTSEKENTISPKMTVSRAQAAKIFMSFSTIDK